MPIYNYGKNIDKLITSSIHVVTGLVNYYIDNHHKEVMKETGGVVHIRPSPLYNAYYKKTFMLVATKDNIDEFARVLSQLFINKTPQKELIQTSKIETRSIKISLYLGIPATIVCLYRVIDYIMNKRHINFTNSMIITQYNNIFDSWSKDTYPSLMEHDNFPNVDYKVDFTEAFNTIYLKARHLLSGQCFVLAHEYGHALLALKHASFKAEYFRKAKNAFAKWAAGGDQIESANLKKYYINKYNSNRDNWIEELAADIIAYEICQNIIEDETFAIEGVVITFFLQLLIETYYDLSNQEIPDSHPYSSSRLLALNHYVDSATHNQNNILIESYLAAKRMIETYKMEMRQN